MSTLFTQGEKAIYTDSRGVNYILDITQVRERFLIGVTYSGKAQRVIHSGGGWKEVQEEPLILIDISENKLRKLS